MIIYIRRFYNPQKFDYITYIPVHKTRLEERGFNQAHLLAERIADYFNLNLAELLIREQATVRQSKLSKLARKENLKQQFKAINHTQIANSKLLLVDDIYTTGTTVNQAAKILLEKEAKEVKIITLATGRDLNLNKENEKI